METLLEIANGILVIGGAILVIVGIVFFVVGIVVVVRLNHVVTSIQSFVDSAGQLFGLPLILMEYLFLSFKNKKKK